jgi:hypothetical protein
MSWINTQLRHARSVGSHAGRLSRASRADVAAPRHEEESNTARDEANKATIQILRNEKIATTGRPDSQLSRQGISVDCRLGLGRWRQVALLP